MLLDTHTFLWFVNGDISLPNNVRQLIQQSSIRLVSIASLWEIAIKINANKLEIGMSIPELVKQHILANQFKILNIEPIHLEVFSKLPLHHRDPFDRLIIAQAMVEQMSVISRDEKFDYYGVQRLWV